MYHHSHQDCLHSQEVEYKPWLNCLDRQNHPNPGPNTKCFHPAHSHQESHCNCCRFDHRALQHRDAAQNQHRHNPKIQRHSLQALYTIQQIKQDFHVHHHLGLDTKSKNPFHQAHHCSCCQSHHILQLHQERHCPKNHHNLRLLRCIRPADCMFAPSRPQHHSHHHLNPSTKVCPNHHRSNHCNRYPVHRIPHSLLEKHQDSHHHNPIRLKHTPLVPNTPLLEDSNHQNHRHPHPNKM